MPQHNRHSVLIVEDMQHTIDQVSQMLQPAPDLHVVGAATTLKQARDMLRTLRPDFVLTDLGLPDGSGIDLIRATREVNWRCDAMVFSVFGDEARVLNAVRAGAKGYILKTNDAAEVTRSIREVIAGGSPITPKIARSILCVIQEENEAQLPTTVKLTNREAEILRLIATGYKRSEVADQTGISVGTVGNHVHNIYRKLEVKSNIEAVAVATRTGLI